MSRLGTLLALLAGLGLWPGLGSAAPEIQHWETSNGVRVYFVPAPELPMLDLRVVFAAGSARDGDKPGLARMTNALLNSGAGSMDADEIARRFESVGAQFGAASLRDMAYVSLRTLTDPDWMDTALETYATVLGNPGFPKRDFERARKQTFVALRDQAQDPGDIAQKAFYAAIYGAHPYATPTIGTEETVGELSREDLKAFYQRYYVARNAVLAMVGGIDRATAERIAERVTTGLQTGERAPAVPGVAALESAKAQRVAFPSEQVHVFIGQTGMSRKDPDYFTLYVGNHILGGSGFTSRLVKEVRSERGFAYSVYSFFLPMAEKGPFMVGLQTRADQADEAVSVVKQTVRDFVENGPTEQELEASKSNITGGFPLRTASNSDIVEYLAVIGFYDLPLDYLNTFTAKVEAVTVDQIRDAFKRRVVVDDMVTVVVGGAGETS